MDNITRIHIAKMPYEIGVEAQKELKQYLKDLRAQLDPETADDIMEDIEGRITEILAERKVNPNGVINGKDVQAIISRLGRPDQIEDDDKPVRANSASLPKKLYRDPENGLIGGVASGLAAYFNIDPILVRLGFVVLTLLWGLSILLYILLWVLVPPADTPSDKLRMRGQAVTAAAIQSYRETSSLNPSSLRSRRVLRTILKVFLMAAGLCFTLFVLTTLGLFNAALYTPPLHQLFVDYRLDYLILALVWLLALSVIGLVIAAILKIWRHGARSLLPAVYIFLALLLLSVAGLSVISPFAVTYYQKQYYGNLPTVPVPVSGTSLKPIDTLNVNANHDLNVNYVITSQPLHAEYQKLPGMNPADIALSENAGSLNVSTSNLAKVIPNCLFNWCNNVYLPVKLTIYGPALTKYNASGGVMFNLAGYNQPTLSVTSTEGADVSLDNGFSTTLNLAASNDGFIDLTPNVTADTANLTVDQSSGLTAPSTTNLNLTLPIDCINQPLYLSAYPPKTTINGQVVSPLQLGQNSCINLGS